MKKIIFCIAILIGKICYANFGVMTVKLVKLPKQINPIFIMDTSTALVLGQVFDSLYRFNHLNQIEPVMVKSQTWNPKLTELSLELDSKSTFSDGSKLSALIVKQSFENLASVLKEKSRWMLGGLVGFDDFINGKKNHIFGIKSKNQKITFIFANPNPAFINYLATPNMLIFKKDKLDPSKLVGTGKYVIQKVVSSKVILNENAFSAKSSLVKEIIFIDKGDADDFNLSFVSETDLNKEKIEFDYLQTMVLIFNTRDSLVSNSEFRCYLAKSFTNAFKSSKYALQPISIGLPFSWFIDDFNSAKKLNPTKSKKTINVDYANSAALFSEDINLNIQKKLSANGIDIVFSNIKIDELLNKLTSKKFDIALLGYVPDFPNADSLLTPFVATEQQYNFSRYSNQKIDNLLKSARDITDSNARNSKYKQVFEILYKDCPIAFLGSQKGILYKDKNMILPKFSSLGFHKIDLSEVKWR